MKDINKIFEECKNELTAIGITTGKITSMTVNTRAKSRWGQCRFNGKSKTYSINIASVLMSDDVSDISTKNTVLHEMLHTCPNCMNHGKEWQALADKVNKAYGYNIKRTTSEKEKGVKLPESTETVHYILKCENCKGEWKYKRHSKIVECCEQGRAKCSCGSKQIKVIYR